MPPASLDVTRCKKRQNLTVLLSDQDVEAYNLSCSSPSFAESSYVAPPALSQPPPVQEISTTNTPSALSALSDTSDHSPFDANTMFNILAHNKRLEDVVAGLSLQNQMLSSELQLACATNSRLIVSNKEEKQELLDEEEEKEQEDEQEEEQGQKQEAAAPISKWDILTN